ncbi:MAG TPA: hypothetical protein VF755_24580 [Catenuloplanes sp.]|jgi:multisubunit Na+/H+ antiporter MnhC subunit
MVDRASEVVTARMAGAVNLAVIVLVAVWHLGYDTVKLVVNWAAYDPAALAAASWVGFAVLNVVGSIALVRGWLRAWPARALALCALVLGAAATAACPPGQALADPSWAWNSVGWFGVLLLLSRPVWELIVMLAANITITGAFLAADNALDDRMLQKFATLVCMTTGVQLIFVLVGRLLHQTASRATEAAEAEGGTLARSRAAAEVHAHRQQRYDFLRRHVEPLLHGLAEGRANPGDPVVQQRCAVAASQLRRLFAETDEGPDPLLRELQACTDVAERRHVQVDLITLGTVPALPTSVRRALTEAPLAVLATAASSARVTVVAGPDEVVVSVLADTAHDIEINPPPGPLSTDWQREGDNLWVETRWNARSPSASSMTIPSSSRESTTGSAPNQESGS